MKIIKWLLLTPLFACHALAQDRADFRGGWLAEIDDETHIYVFVIKGETVTGSFCSKDCTNPANLAFVDNGTLVEDTLQFTLYHDSSTGEEIEQLFSAALVNGELRVSNESSNTRNEVFKRSPVVDDVPPAPSGGFVARRTSYEPPVPLSNVTMDRVVGLWLAGDGAGKQNFIFKRHQDGLRGMVCGPCNDAANMAPLENIRIMGNSLYFDIVHENSGPGITEHGPHVNITRAVISKNEMHLWVIPGFEDQQLFTPIEMTLHGPVIYQDK